MCVQVWRTRCTTLHGFRRRQTPSLEACSTSTTASTGTVKPNCSGTTAPTSTCDPSFVLCWPISLPTKLLTALTSALLLLIDGLPYPAAATVVWLASESSELSVDWLTSGDVTWAMLTGQKRKCPDKPGFLRFRWLTVEASRNDHLWWNRIPHSGCFVEWRSHLQTSCAAIFSWACACMKWMAMFFPCHDWWKRGVGTVCCALWTLLRDACDCIFLLESQNHLLFCPGDAAIFFPLTAW